MKSFIHYLLSAATLLTVVACNTAAPGHNDDARMTREIKLIDTLLRDVSFAEFMSRSLDSAYYAGLGQAQPQFLNPGDDTAAYLMRVKDEKIATSIAGFYALECAAELLSKKTNSTFVSWLDNIITGQAGNEPMLLLNRFANATWKAGQPFRDLERLKRYNFTVAGLLSKEEVMKDSIQIVNAAKKLRSLMQPVASAGEQQQMQALRTILHDTAIAASLAHYSDSSYAVSQHQQAPSPVSPRDTAMVRKTVKQMKIATSMAGFYALECGLNYLVTTDNSLPTTILDSLASGKMAKDKQVLFARFANATWKAGQPFRGLGRITRDTFTPFYFLSEADIDKDLVQVKAAASLLLQRMRKNLTEP